MIAYINPSIEIEYMNKNKAQVCQQILTEVRIYIGGFMLNVDAIQSKYFPTSVKTAYLSLPQLQGAEF